MWALRMLLCCATHSNVYSEMLCCSVLKRRAFVRFRCVWVLELALVAGMLVCHALTTRLPFMHAMHSTTVVSLNSHRYTFLDAFSEHSHSTIYCEYSVSLPHGTRLQRTIQLQDDDDAKKRNTVKYFWAPPPINTPVIFWKFENDSGPTLPAQRLCIPFKLY